MISTPRTVPEILRDTQIAVDPARYPIRLLACGIPDGVESVVRRLYLQGFAHIDEWSKPLPSPIAGEVIRILTRHYEM